jgi:hypothetical protein
MSLSTAFSASTVVDSILFRDAFGTARCVACFPTMP